jgi:deoxycytidine triphosphate deaminase
MILGTKELLRLVHEENLVENLCERELTNPEGAGFDLRVGKFYVFPTYVFPTQGNAYLGVEQRKTPATSTVDVDRYLLYTNESILVETMESVNMPDYLAGHVLPRTTLFRSGLNLRTGPVHPGYHGTLTFLLTNLGYSTVEIEQGARIAHMQFHVVSGDLVRLYEGQWQGGRVSQPELETQV